MKVQSAQRFRWAPLAGPTRRCACLVGSAYWRGLLPFRPRCRRRRPCRRAPHVCRPQVRQQPPLQPGGDTLRRLAGPVARRRGSSLVRRRYGISPRRAAGLKCRPAPAPRHDSHGVKAAPCLRRGGEWATQHATGQRSGVVVVVHEHRAVDHRGSDAVGFLDQPFGTRR